jgi:hypothetical protein
MRRTIQLHELRVINLLAEQHVDHFAVGAETVGGELEATREPLGQIVNEQVAVSEIASADAPMRNKLRVGIGRDPKPNVAGLAILSLLKGGIALFGSDEAQAPTAPAEFHSRRKAYPTPDNSLSRLRTGSSMRRPEF